MMKHRSYCTGLLAYLPKMVENDQRVIINYFKGNRKKVSLAPKVFKMIRSGVVIEYYNLLEVLKRYDLILEEEAEELKNERLDHLNKAALLLNRAKNGY